MAITCGVDWLLHHGRGRLSLVTRTAALSVAFLSLASCVPCLLEMNVCTAPKGVVYETLLEHLCRQTFSVMI